MTTLHKIQRNKELRKNIIMSLLLVLLLRIFYSIPTPGTNITFFKNMAQMNELMGFVNLLSGSGLSSMAVMSLNITPYISASIIIQLLATIIPKLKDMQEGMSNDRKKLERITIILGVVLAFTEGIAIAMSYGSRGMLVNYTWYWVLIVAGIWAIGAGVSSIVGKIIQDKYKFNGVSLILLFNIISAYPTDGQNLYYAVMAGKAWYWQVLIGIAALVLVVALFVFTYYIQETEKRLKINYTGKAVNGANKTIATFPIKLCPGGVVPIIFASSLMTFPVMIVGLFGVTNTAWGKFLSSGYWFNINDPLPTLGVIVYIAMIFGFSYFYTDMTLNIKQISDNIKKAGGNISGIRPGRETEEYFQKQIKGVIAIGAAALTVIAILPMILSGAFGIPRLSFLGTSIIITVGVLCEIKNMIDSYTKVDNYTNTKKKRGGLF